MEEMISIDSPQRVPQPGNPSSKSQQSPPIPRSVLLALGVFVLCFAVLFAGPVVALRLVAGPSTGDQRTGGAGGWEPDVRASAVVTTVVLQTGKPPFINGFPTGPVYTGGRDTYINRWIPNTNFGLENRLILGQSQAYRTLLYFDLAPAAIPSGATIVGADVGIYCHARNLFNSMEARAYQVIRPWLPTQATWYKATSSDNWTFEGCDHVGTDREGTPLDTHTVFVRNAFHDFDITSAVQGWISNPASNEGVILIAPDPAVIYYYRSSRYTAIDERPRLVITWTMGAPTPTPTATATKTPTTGPSPTPTHTRTPTPAPDIDFIYDETSLCYSHTPAVGVWQVGTTGGYGGSYEYEQVANPSRTARWGPCAALPLSHDSMYRVDAHWSVAAARPVAVPYDIHYDGGSTIVYVNQTKNAAGSTVANGSASGWYSLGVYPFQAGTSPSQYVELNTSSPGDTCADAVRWVRLPGTPGPAYTLTVTADPVELPSDGVSVSTIVATVRDQFGNLVSDGTLVGFTTTLGSLPYAYVEAEAAGVTKLGTWSEYSDAAASGGKIIYSDTQDDEVSWTFYGEAISLIYAMNVGGGTADVSIDGAFAKSIDFDSPSLMWRVEEIIDSGLGAGTHTVRLRHTGGGRVWLDAFRSGASTVGGVAAAPLTAPLTTGTATVGVSAIGTAIPGSSPVWPYAETTVAFPGPNEVWVDDDYCGACANGGHIWNFDAFDNIQDGVDKVLSGGTVHVLAGTYMENVTVNKPISLLGSGSDVTVLDGGSDPPGSRGFYVDRADGVTISGFKIRDYETGVYLRGTGSGSGPRVYDATVVQNAFVSNNAGPGSRAVYGTYVYTGTICSNDISLGYNGIYLENAYGLTICYNEIYDNNGYGITINVGDDSSIDNNHIHNNQNVGIELAGTTKNNGVFNNSLHDLFWDGVLVNGSGTSTVQVVANTISRTNLVWLDAAASAPDANHNLGGVALVGTTGSEVYSNSIIGVSNAQGNRADAAGVYLKSNTAPSIESNLIVYGAAHGIHIPPGGGVATIHGNSIYGNGRFGLNNKLAANLHAEGNWWGRNSPTDGPSEPADIFNRPSVFWSPPISLTLSANPTAIPANGVATSDIIANAGGFGYDILDGTTITFTSDLSTLIFPATATFAGGEAQTTLRAGTVAGVATVTGSAEPGIEAQTTNVTLLALAPNSLEIDVSSASIPVGCDPLGQASVTATVRDIYLNPVPGVSVNFSSNGLGSVAPGSGVTAPGTGQASTTFSAFLTPGTATVTATAGATLTASANIEVTAGPPDEGQVSIVAYPTSLLGNGVDTSLILVPMGDCGSNPVPDGTMVGFTTTLGTILDFEYVEAESPSVVTSPGWTVGSGGGRSYLQSTTPGSTAFWNFRGAAVSIVFRRFASGGVLRASVDGGPPMDINTSGSTAWTERILATGLDPLAVHTLALTCQSGTVRLDAFRSGAVSQSGVATATLKAPVLPYTGTAVVYATTRLDHQVLPELVVTTSVVISRSEIIWVDDNWAGLASGTAVPVPGNTAYIGANAFDNIPDAVVAVLPGGTVSVLDGYYPTAVNITQTLHLLGYYGAASTVIDGTGSGNGIRVRPVADGATIDGFTIQDWGFGVYLDGRSGNSLDNVTVSSNLVSGCSTGAITSTYVNDASVADNTMYGSTGFAFDLFMGDGNSIQNNTVHDIAGFGMRLQGASNANVSYNTVYDIDWDGLHIGLDCTDAMVSHNTVWSTNRTSSGSGFDNGGIVLYSTTDSSVLYNSVRDVGTAGGSTDTAGIWVGGNDRRAVIEYNHALYNQNDGVLLWDFISGSPPVLHCNHIYGNVRFGLRDRVPIVLVNAEGNWWGKNDPTRGTTPPKDIYRPTPMNVDWDPPIVLTVAAAQPWVLAGSAPIQVTATACGGGCCLFDGTPITFTTDLGGLGVPPGATVVAYMSGGQAVVMFDPGTVRGVATITAAAEDAGLASTTVTVRPLDPASIEVIAVPTSIPVGNIIPSAITATVRDIYGNKVLNGTLIDFATTLGWTLAPTGTTVGGVATTTLYSGVTPGIATVSASWGIVVGTVDVEFTAGPPNGITCPTADPPAILGNGLDTSTITAIVRDLYGNLVSDGTMVGFTTTAGSLIYEYVEAEAPDVITSTAWTKVLDAGASGGAYIRTSTVAAEAYWIFRGQAVSVRYRRYASGGVMSVRVDGGPPMMIDTSGASAWVEEVVATGLNPAAVHEVRVACVSGQIRVDAFRSGAATNSGVAQATLTSQLLPPVTAEVYATAIGGSFPTCSVFVEFLEPLEVWVDDDYCATCANDGHQWGFDAYDNIPDGITAVRSGGTVHVLDGTYTTPVVINKPLNLDGAGSGSTSIIEGTGTGNGIRVTRFADGSTVEGFLIRDFGFGVFLDGRSTNYLDGFTFTDNVITGCVTGAITATYVNAGYFADNALHHNDGFGFDLYTGSSNRLRNNHVYQNDEFGVRLRATTDARISFNNLHDLGWDGIRLGGGCVGTQVLSNTVRSTSGVNSASGFNGGGIVLNSTSNTIVEWNLVTDVGTAGGGTDTGGIWVGGTNSGGTFRHNQLVGNDNQGITIVGFSSPPTVNCNHIYANGRHGIYNMAGTDVPAQGNWWGHNPPLTNGLPPPTDIRPAADVLWDPPIVLTLTPAVTTVSAGSPPILVTAQACGGGCCILDGTPITFTTDLGGLGSPPTSPVLSVMNGGQAVVSFSPGITVGLATLSAFLPDMGVATATVTITAGAPYYMDIAATPESIWSWTCRPAGYPRKSTVAITVTDQYGNPCIGEWVDYMSSPTSDASLEWINGVLDVNGYHQTILDAGDAAGTVMVTATVGTVTESVPVEVMSGPPADMVLNRWPTVIAADGVSTSTITATVRDACGNLMWDGTMVGFVTDRGSLPYALAEAESSAVEKSVGDWSTLTNASASGGSLLYAYNQANAGAWMRWGFQGSAVSVLYRRAVDGGSLRIFVDGLFIRTLDMAAASTEWQRETVVITGLDPLAPHVIDLEVEPSTDATERVYIDALRSGATTMGGVATAVLTSSRQNTVATISATAIDSRLPHQSAAQRIVRTTTVEFRRADLVISKTASPVDVPPEELVNFVILYSNTGVAQGTSALITDTLPTALTYVTASSAPALAAPTNPSDNEWVWQAGNVLPGATGVITVTARRSCPSPIGWVTNVVSITSLTLDSNAFNNSGTRMVNYVRGAPYYVTVTSDPTAIPIDSYSTVRVLVTDQCENPIQSATVYMTTSLGSFAPAMLPNVIRTTNASGRANVSFYGGLISGTATIDAAAVDAYGLAYGAGYVFVGVGPAEQCLAAANPVTIPADGVSTSKITARVLDSGGNPVPDGFFVGFTTTLGSLVYDYAEETSGVQSPPGSWTVGSNAAASGGSYWYSNVDGAVLFWSFRGNACTLVYRQAPGAGVADLSLDGNPLGPVDMSGPSTWRAEKIYTWIGSPTAAHTFRVAHRPGTGPVYVDAFRSGTTTAAMQALAVLTSEQTVGTATVAATAISPTAGLVPEHLPAFVEVGFGPANLVVTKTVSPVDFVTVGDALTFTLQYQNTGPMTATNAYIEDTITDGLGPGWWVSPFFSVPPTVVTPDFEYRWDLGSLAPGATGSIQFGGTIDTGRYWPSRTVLTNTAVIDSLTVDNARGNNTRRVTVTVVPAMAFQLDLTASLGSIPVGGATSQLRAAVRDMYGNPVPDDTTVTFRTSLGGFPSVTERVRLTAAGEAVLNLTSGPLVGTAYVTATVDSISDHVQVLFTPLGPHTITVTGIPPQITVGGATSAIQALVVDQYGNRVANGTLVSFATSLGSIAPPSSATVNGVAYSVLTSGTTAGSAIVTATSGAASGTGTVIFVAGAPRLTVTANPVILNVGQISNIRAIAKDAFGNNVPNGTVVTFTTSLGYFTQSSGDTTYQVTSGGQANAGLTSTEPGTAVVEARVGSDLAAVLVTFNPGPPRYVEVLSVEPAIIESCVGTALARARVTDQFGNPVRDGTVVVFDVTPQGDAEPIDGGRTSGGVAQAIISAGTVPGPATLWAWPEAYRTSVVDDFGIEFTEGPPDRVEVTVQPPQLMVGGSRATVRARVVDCGGNPVEEGTLVTVTIASGGGSLMPQTTTTVGGWAYSTLTSPDETGAATIRARSDNREGTAVVQYIPGPPFDILLSADPLSIPADGLSTSTIGAEVRDRYGNSVADRMLVVFSTDLGSFETGLTYRGSTSGGRAGATLKSSTTPGIARVAALAGGVRREIFVDFFFAPTPTPSRPWKAYMPLILKRRFR